MLTAPAVQATQVNAISGGLLYSGNYYGYSDGNSLTQARYHAPIGLAMDTSGQYLFVADRDNNAIRYLDLSANQTWTFTTNYLNKPVGVAIDPNNYVYVLNRGNGNNGNLLTFDNYGDLILTNAAKLTNAAGMTMDTSGNIYLTINSNKLVKISPFITSTNTSTTTNIVGSTTNIVTTTNVVTVTTDATNLTTIATINIAKTSLQGLVVKHNGLIALCDSGRNGIYLVNPATGVVTTNAGFLGTGDFITNSTDVSTIATAKFNQPSGVAETGDGKLLVTDYGNNRVKVISSIVVSNLYGITQQYWNTSYYPGWADGTVFIPDSQTGNNHGNVAARTPNGIVFGYDGSIYVTEDYYHLIRKVTASGLAVPPPVPPGAPLSLTITATNYGTISISWSASSGATNYNVKRSNSSGGPYTTIGSTTGTTYTDTTVANGVTYYYVVSAVNSGGESVNSAEVSATAPVPPPPAPRIGWFDYEGNNISGFTTVLHPITLSVFNNDQLLAVDPGTNGVSTYYIAGPNPLTANPSHTNGTTPPTYQDGLFSAQSLTLNDVPDLVVKAVNVDALGQSSPVTTAEFVFQVANPSINGLNGAQFTISDVTSNTVFWYTTDGTDPTNAPPSIGPLATDTNGDPIQLSFNLSTNLLFKVRGFKNNYFPSGIALQSFSSANFNPNTISFGFASGEASSTFIASAGQTFYAPVTLTMISNTPLYSLQFNLSVTNAGPNPGPAVTAGAYGFNSFLEEPIPGSSPVIYEKIPPLSFYPDFVINPPPVNQIVPFDGPNGDTNFINMTVTNTTQNYVSVGWLERIGQKNLFDTGQQNLLTYSQAHDVIYPFNNNGLIEVGGFSFQVPVTATNGQTYQIQIGRPSATDDGIGDPGSDVFISNPNNSNFGGGSPVSANKYVTVGQRKYLVGSVYNFHWFNAGDFGGSNLISADVAQVFQSAIYNLNNPPPGSDFFDAMDSCGSYLAYLDGDTGHYTNDTTQVGHANALFSGDDNSINHLAYGDGVLDVCDVYVTFRRSTFTNSQTWFERYWSNGQRVADALAPGASPNIVSKVVTQSGAQTKVQTTTTPPQVNFTAGDAIGVAGKQILVPITATVLGTYPVRVLMLNLTVTPLDGSPALTTQVTFNQNTSLLGTAYPVGSDGYNNLSAAWLNSTNAGFTGTFVVGNLVITLPATANSNAAYAIHFDHASASPNGLASFPKSTLTGVLTTSSRTNSSYGDGIPDTWRLRWFGTVNNILSVSNACPSGDNVNNWKKYVAGVDPSTANDFPQVNSKTLPSGYNAAIHWPSVNGKKYVIQRANTLFSSSWSLLTTNIGTGGDMEYDDSNTNKMRFYRVLIMQ